MSDENWTNSLYSGVLERLRIRIAEGGQAAPEPLKISQISEELNASPTPVREALAQLAGEGIVTLEPRRGYHSVPLSISKIEECYQILDALVGAGLTSGSSIQQIDSSMANTLLIRLGSVPVNADERAAVFEDTYRVLLGAGERTESLRIAGLMINRTHAVRVKLLADDPCTKSLFEKMAAFLSHLFDGDQRQAKLEFSKLMLQKRRRVKRVVKDIILAEFQ